MDNDKQPKGARGQEAGDRALETERAVSTDRLCEGCGADLTSRRRQARYCSPNCRACHSRKRREERIQELISVTEDSLSVTSESLAALKREIGGDHED